MRRLVRLYPSTWRERYGDEFEALLEDVRASPSVVADVALGALRARLSALRERPSPMAEGGIVTDVERAPDHGSTFALLGLLILSPTLVFLALAGLKYGLAVHAPFDAASPFFLVRFVEYWVVLAPWLAFVLAAAPIVRLRVSRDAGIVTAGVTIRFRALNVAVGLLSAAVIVFLLAFFLAENF